MSKLNIDERTNELLTRYKGGREESLTVLFIKVEKATAILDGGRKLKDFT
jgi:hypothetical protein